MNDNPPKKLWDFWPHDGGTPVIWREPCPFPADDADVFEYILNSEALAMVAAEQEACAKMLNRYAAEKGSTKTPQGRTANFYGRKIRARTPADAQAALEAVKREARNEGLRKAAELAMGGKLSLICCASSQPNSRPDRRRTDR